MSLDRGREATILAGLRSGDAARHEQAFGELYEAVRVPLFSLCLHLTGDRADAEDALQDTLLAVHGGIRRFQARSRLTTWIYRIAMRTAIRRRARRRRNASAPFVVEPAAPDAPDPVVAEEEAARVARALATLSAPHRAVLALFAVDGVGHEEIAETLGVPVGTVWSRLHHARKKLAAELAAATSSSTSSPRSSRRTCR
jgi:RNA polymerase sigma factor (sigma-70 family)